MAGWQLSSVQDFFFKVFKEFKGQLTSDQMIN
jgi:hypothetical protein